MMQSRQRRAGAPLLFAFGAKREDGALRVPLLIFSAQLDPLTYDLFDPDDPQVVVRVTLPESLLDRPRDAHATHVTLEVA